MTAPRRQLTTKVLQDYVGRLVSVDAAVKGCIPIAFTFTFADAATNSQTIVVADKIEVIDAFVLKQGADAGAANTVQVKNNATAITDAMSTNLSNKGSVRMATIDGAASIIAAGGSLVVTNTRAAMGQSACRVIVYALLLA
jgi:hypothetical protein